MKARHYVLAAMLVGAMAVDSAAAKPAHHKDKGADQGSTGAGPKASTAGAHTTTHASDLGKGANSGSSTTGTAVDAKDSGGDRDRQKSDGSVDQGEMKRGDHPGKSGPHNADTSAPQIGERNGHLGSNGEHATVDTGKSDAWKSEPVKADNVIVDHHHDKKPITNVKTKSKTPPTVFHAPSTGPHPSGLAAIGGGPRTATGLPLQNDPKADVKVTPETGPKETTAVGTPPAPTTHPDVKPSTEVAKVIPGLNGSTINKPGSGPATLGGATKNVASLNGTTFRPKHGR
jgi:hypothetical protein